MDLNFFSKYLNEVNSLHANFSTILSAQNRPTFEKIVKLKNEFEEIHLNFIKDISPIEELGVKINFSYHSITFTLYNENFVYNFKYIDKLSISTESLSLKVISLISKISHIFDLDSLKNIATYYLEFEHLKSLYEKNILNRKSKDFTKKVDYIKDYFKKQQSIEFIQEAYKNKDHYIFLSLVSDKNYQSLSLKKYRFNKKSSPDLNKLFALKIQNKEYFIDYNDPFLKQFMFKEIKRYYYESYEINVDAMFDKLNLEKQIANF